MRTAEEEIKSQILIDAAKWGDDYKFDTYDDMVEAGMHWDGESDFRGRGIDTDIDCEWSRHYESKSLARKLDNGLWVGWTYWYGGGKHGNPEEIEWMGDAYFLDVTEEEKVVTVRTFKRKGE